MKILLTITLLFTLLNSSKKDYSKIIVYQYIREANDIMDTLGISTRKFIKLDDSVSVIIVKELEFLNAMFGCDSVLFKGSNHKKRYYKNPVIALSPDLHKIIEIGWYYSDSFTVRAKSRIIHESAHYLQKTNDDTINAEYLFNLYKTDEKKYISIPVELEAHAVEAYYWLRYYKPEVLKKLLLIKDMDTKLKTIIDESRESLGKNRLY